MANKSKSDIQDIKDFEKDYNKIIKSNQTTILNNLEWSSKGDSFIKFTLYKEYTPVKTSCNTTLLINNI